MIGLRNKRKIKNARSYSFSRKEPAQLAPGVSRCLLGLVILGYRNEL